MVFNEPDIFVPSAFTPNNDGRNDILKAIAPGIKQFLLFRIYNRWGNRVFESNDPDRGWDGKSDNRDAPVGGYVWLVQGIDYKGNRIERRGTVLLIH
jgi:gliding motility-associated-like protein